METDALFLNGGEFDLVDGHHEVVGLRQRLASEGLTEGCTIVEQDYMTLPASGDFQLVMGSGLWSMPPTGPTRWKRSSGTRWTWSPRAASSSAST